MKKILIVIVTFLISINFVFPQKHFYEWENLKMSLLLKECKLNGIKKLQLKKIDYEYGVPLNWGIIIKDYTFDDNFNLIEQKFWDEQEYAGKIIYQYNQNQDTILIKKYDEDDEEVYRYEFEYTNGKLTKKKYFEGGDLEYVEYYKYNDKNLLQEKKRIKDDELDFIEYYKYDAQDMLSEYSFFDEDSVEKVKSMMFYTPLGLITDSVVYFDGIEDAKFQYKYDAQGNVVEKIYSSPDLGQLERITYKYNVHGKLVEMRVFDDQDVMVELYYINYDDDNHNRITKLEIYGENEFLIGSWRYEYFRDSDHNLLKKETYLNKLDLPQFLIKYEYEPKQR